MASTQIEAITYTEDIHITQLFCQRKILYLKKKKAPENFLFHSFLLFRLLDDVQLLCSILYDFLNIILMQLVELLAIAVAWCRE